ncbi:poly-gamma-glutamate hydrolase family protein [Dactylosporangium roseum]|uniref:Poly-gamma-glutamate hydrolase family protein n=1 Tax=Dactylosporangium roseum TaxID=47989 RepID=A0ABY5Z740_9ACTN|nr:poly-gamma-glutamate hydrolase family protein [Dactylosporangium roseum]UWZ37474.1 poly-gamma-glutamate hydrolase family protein [Dactylosporangium roseum]
MPPPYTSYAALAAEQTEGVDYSRTAVTPTGATWAAISIHGGGIEGGSGEMAQQVAGSRMRYYQFAGLKTSGNSDLHITSALFDEPNCVALVSGSQRTLSFHGFTGTAGVAETAIGGLDAELVGRITSRLQAAGFSVITAPSEIAGTDPANICNLNARSAGVQLEMSNALRSSFFVGGSTSAASRAGPRTQAFYDYARAVSGAYEGMGRMSLGSVNVSRWATLVHPTSTTDQQISVTVATDALATGGSHFAAAGLRFTDTNNTYLARLDFSTSATVTLTLRKRVAGTETLLATASANALIHAAGRRFGLTFSAVGSTLSARTWLDGTAEPVGWQVTATDTDISSGPSVGLRGILSSANTNTLPVMLTWDHVSIGVQRLSATRSVNGVSKAHAAGTGVALWAPVVLAL